VHYSLESALEISKHAKAISALTDTECKALWNYCLAVTYGAVVVEVGCQYGRSSSLIGQAQALRGFHAIHIDPYLAVDDGVWVNRPDILSAWTSMRLSINKPFTLLCMKTEEAEWHLERLCRDGIDLAFIDGDHEREAVEIDMALVGSRVKSGGVMMCHDYPHVDFPGLAHAVNVFTVNGWTKEGHHDSLGVWRRL
jgi:hypothetical protein